jgi:hypothetical protein
MFATMGSANSHANTVHLRLKDIPCPLADKYRCATTFSQRGSANQHARAVHLRLKKIPCPLADEYQCITMFATMGNANSHANIVHLCLKDIPCPLADKYQCVAKFAHKTFARIHADEAHLHLGKFPCPLADQYECTAIFPRKSTAQKHARDIHLNRFICLIPGCLERFPTEELAAQHAKGVNLHQPEDFFICPVSTCRCALRRKPISMRRKTKHMMRHKKRGQLTGSEVLQPVKPYISSRCDLYDLILHNSRLDKQEEGKDDDKDEANKANGSWSGKGRGGDDDDDDDDDEEEEEDDEEEDDDDNISFIPQLTEDHGAGLLSEESRLRILAHNTKFWSV